MTTTSSCLDIEKFNEMGYELWQLKMEDLLKERDQWVVVTNKVKPSKLSDED